MSDQYGRFCGFVIANEGEEYFGGYRDLGEMASIAWVKIPDLAQRFLTAGAANAMIRKVEFSYPVWLLRLYETETQFRVSIYGGSVPPWIVGLDS